MQVLVVLHSNLATALLDAFALGLNRGLVVRGLPRGALPGNCQDRAGVAHISHPQRLFGGVPQHADGRAAIEGQVARGVALVGGPGHVDEVLLHLVKGPDQRSIYPLLSDHRQTVFALQEGRQRLRSPDGRPMPLRSMAVKDGVDLPASLQQGYAVVVLPEAGVRAALPALGVVSAGAALLQQVLSGHGCGRPEENAAAVEGLLGLGRAARTAGLRSAGGVPAAVVAIPGCNQLCVVESLLV
mmetsp:Transcript_9999/g.29860  ORF Transcript_9999/g.29860 Transcript_9999/m.29860 type:complete len:242 (+) Transcript_9999:509-1234(+)